MLSDDELIQRAIGIISVQLQDPFVTNSSMVTKLQVQLQIDQQKALYILDEVLENI